MVTFESLKKGKDKIGVVGLGYVGLPLAVYMSKEFKVVGYDMNKKRIHELKAGIDKTREVTPEELKAASMEYTDDPQMLASCRLIIVAVPTPIDEFRNPDFRPLIGASQAVGKAMKKGTCVTFESTVCFYSPMTAGFIIGCPTPLLIMKKSTRLKSRTPYRTRPWKKWPKVCRLWAPKPARPKCFENLPANFAWC